MANINKIKAGSSDPTALMFDKYRIGTANNGIFFGSIIPKDNSNAATQETSNSAWQINDGWEVEIINSKKIAIKKFKIDTWGLRQIVPIDTRDNYNSLKIKVTGITRVHNEVICHTAGSNTPDGFTKAYGGTGGYNVYWYPGQFESGNSMQGLVIQKSIGYSANDNERDDSLQIGKHPWDVGTRACTVDDIATDTVGDWSYRAISIGIYGGVQNATSWHDENGDAYRQYDISDNPIYLDLNVEDSTKEIDVTSVECWDAYTADEKIYHKDKTLDNCWKKYGLAFPTDWKITKTDFNANEYIEWISPTKFKIKGIPEGGITIATNAEIITWNYQQVDLKQFIVKLSQGLPSGASIKIVRAFTNAYYTYNEESHTWTDPVEDIETVLSVGDNTIAAFSDEIHKKDTDAEMTYSECKIVITSDEPIYNMSCNVEVVPTFTDGQVLTVNASKWGLSKVVIPQITDLEEHIDKLMFNCNPANADFWEPIKAFYADNVLAGDAVYRKFRNAGNLDELALILPNTAWLSYDNTFKFSSIKKLTLTGQTETTITSLNGIFEGLGKLKELVVNVDPEHSDGDYLAGANDCSNMFNGCGLETYPANFIAWNRYRTNANNFSKNATHAMSMFWWCSIKNVPNYGNDPDSDENTILCGTASGMFNRDGNLETVGPIVDLQLIKPQATENIFVGCTKLTTIRIKNLNHGDWHFDDTEFASGKKHGTLAALNTASVQYLFANLTDLNLYDPDKNNNTINNSFAEWSSNYFNSGIYESAYNFKFNSMSTIVGHLRTATQNNAPFIVHTNKQCTITFNVKGLVEGDSLIFTAAGTVEPDLVITENGQYTVTKTDNIDKGFKLIGDSSIKTNIQITLDKGWDLSVPTVNAANLYCPAEWADKITDEMVTAANAKNWTIYIGGTIKTV